MPKMTKQEEASEQRALDAEAALAALEKEAEKKDAERAELEKSVTILTARVDELHSANVKLTEAARLAELKAENLTSKAIATEVAVARAQQVEAELTLVKLQRDEAAERANRMGAASAPKDTSTGELFGEKPGQAIGLSDAVPRMGLMAVMAATGLDPESAAARLRLAILQMEAHDAAIRHAASEVSS